MKINRTDNNQINFGFNYNTHRNIAEKLINEEFPKLKKYSPAIKEAVVMPDFDEFGFKLNTHFYFPLTSYIRPRASFLDIDGTHNAYSRYSSHVENFQNALKNGQFSLMADEIGRAKHFLDDMSVGLHTKRGNFIQKWRELKIHSAFEDFIYHNENELFANSKPSGLKLKSDSFDDIFVSVVERSSNSEVPTEENISKWAEIAQNTVNLALDSSRVFLGKISDMLK